MIRIITCTIFLAFLCAFGGRAQHGMLLAKPAAGGGATYLLDTYTGAAAAYAVNKLKSDADSCMVIRRSSDNATQLIGFSGDDIDEATINSHCAATNCFVVRWCDQTGNGNDAVQSTTTQQPQIASSGTIILENTVAAIQFDGATSVNGDCFSIPTISSTNSNYSIFSVNNHTGSTGDDYLLDSQTGRLVISADNTAGAYYDGAWKGTTFGNAGQELKSFVLVSTGASVYLNGSANQTGLTYSQVAISASTQLGHRFDKTVTAAFTGNMQLFIIYASDQSANRTGIETEINTYYSIY